MLVRDALPHEMEAVLHDSHEVWGAGLSLPDYVGLNRELRDTPWGRERYRFLVLLDDAGAVASGMKLYTFPGELDGRSVLIAGVGAVFTPPARRGRGHAAALVEGALSLARDRGHHLALLLSEIGGDYYERLGFSALPAQEAACMAFLPVPWPKEPAWVGSGDPFAAVAGLRPYRPEDLDAVWAIHEEATSGQRFRVRRERPRWEHVLRQADLETRLRRDGADHRWVLESAGGIQAYLILKEGKGRILWKEHGALPGAEDALVDLFWAALALARSLGVGRIDAWQFPSAVTRGSRYPIARRARRDPLPMLRPLGEGVQVPAFAGADECLVSWPDAF